MKTPEESKKGLECCINRETGCTECPYDNLPHDECVAAMKSDTLAYIQQLERERDAAVNSLKRYAACNDCKHFSELNCNERSDFLPCYVACCDQKCPCGTCKYGSNWQWRGEEAE